MTEPFLLIVFIAYLFFVLRRLMTYLHIFQQEEYDHHRFLRWMAVTRTLDTRLTIILIIVSVLSFTVPPVITLLLLTISFGVIGVIEADPRKAAKKKLVMTQRAQRIYFIALAIMVVTALWWFILPVLPWLWIFNVQLAPFALIIANGILLPYENSVQNRFWQEAHKKLLDHNPKVIGITGSYGKTSVKHILGHILKMQAPTLITPGSVNTPMGITRIIREQLDETHKYFIAEMGAYGPGSVARLCRLAPPDVGVITAIGAAHYERFKSLETVAEAKFELAEAALAKDGIVVVHDSCLRFEHAQKMVDARRDKFVVCGITSKKDMDITSVTQNQDGLDVRLIWHGQPYILNIPLYGLHHGQNAALAFAAAAVLGVPPNNIVTALKSVPQITHRLEVKKQGDEIIIDDAFNSNPEGFMSALDLLGTMGHARKILITPGMVELGLVHDEQHEKIGRRAGEVCDVVLLVMPERVPTFVSGFKETGPGKTLIEVGSFKEASAWLDTNRLPGDAVLIENDLPDLYEAAIKI